MPEPSGLSAEHRIATYGTLGPGRPNHHQLSSLDGRWFSGHVSGTFVDAGWGAALGYPALVLGVDGQDVEGQNAAVDVFESADLPEHWTRLDRFEGPGYERIITTVSTPSGHTQAYIYVLA